MFLVESLKPTSNTRSENWNADWESLQRKMGYNIQQSGVHLLASTCSGFVRGRASKEGERFYTVDICGEIQP
jgi:hypothetical protein